MLVLDLLIWIKCTYLNTELLLWEVELFIFDIHFWKWLIRLFNVLSQCWKENVVKYMFTELMLTRIPIYSFFWVALRTILYDSDELNRKLRRENELNLEFYNMKPHAFWIHIPKCNKITLSGHKTVSFNSYKCLIAYELPVNFIMNVYYFHYNLLYIFLRLYLKM